MFMEIQFFLAQMKVNYRVSEVKTVKCPSSKFNFPLKPFWLPIISSWPSYEFHFEGLSNFSPLVEGLVWIQDVNLRVQKWNMKLILNLCMNYMVHVSSTMWRIKNQPSNFTSCCSDNALCLLVLVVGRLYWGLQATSSFLIWDCVLKDCFERGIFWRAKSRLKGIGEFNLEHWWRCPKSNILTGPSYGRGISTESSDVE